MVLMPGEETGELSLELGFGAEYRKNLLKNFSVGVGADFMTYQTKDLFGITRINSIEVENEIVEQQPKITETSLSGTLTGTPEISILFLLVIIRSGSTSKIKIPSFV